MRQRVRAAGHSLAGDGMLLRLRNASIALVAAVAAVGLGLTLFIAQLGFPGVFSAPIPGNPTQAGTVHDAIALSRGPDVASSSPGHRAQSAPVAARHSGRAGGLNASGGGPGDSHQLAVSPGVQQGPAGSHPASQAPVSEPTVPPAEPSPPAPAVTPTPVAVETPAGSGGGQPKGASGGKSQSSAPSTAKATSDAGGKSSGQQTAKSGGQTTSVGKSNNAAAEKAGKDQSAAASPKPVAPPAPTPASKPEPEAVSPAAAKEAADSGKSDSTRH